MDLARPLVASFVIASCGAPAQTAKAPTPQDQQEANLRQLREEQVKWEASHKVELARWTPELHAAARALAEKKYSNGRAAIEAAVAGTHRKPGNAERDKYRHPVETLEVFGFEPNMKVLEVDPGEGWYTELLAPALATAGKLLVTSDIDAGERDEGRRMLATRFRAFLDTAPELFGKVELVKVDSLAPSLALDGVVDMVLLMREVHGWVNRKTLARWLAEVHKALKPNGILGVEDHRAQPSADPAQAAKLGYVPEKWIIEQIEAAGFELVAESEVNANPKDTKDYPDGVWTLPPVLQLGAKDRDRYIAIGESDRMTLKFVRSR